MAKRKVRQARRGAERATGPAAEPVAEPEAASGGEPPRERASRGKLVALGTGVVLLVAVVIGAVVLASGDEGGELEYLDGVVVVSDDDRLVLRLPEPVDGEDQIEMTILPEDRESVDIEHLDYHQVAGDTFRIYYDRDGDGYLARRAEDLPGVSH